MFDQESIITDSFNPIFSSNFSQNSFSVFLHSGPKRLPKEVPTFSKTDLHAEL